MPKILIIDDDEVQRDIYVAVFTDAGFEVHRGADGLDGWERFLALHPDIVFTGIMMPRMNGFELVDKIHKENPNLPVIMFSHLGKPEDRKRAEEKHIVFMVKGLDSPRKILEKAKELLAHQPKTNK